jgi:hypothetical protein
MNTSGTVNIPITVSNNSSYSQLSPITHWFTNAVLDFPNTQNWFNPILSTENVNILDKRQTVNIFPNPVGEVLNIEANFLTQNARYIVEIIDPVANIIIKMENHKIEGNKIIINVKNLNNGVYFLKVYDPENDVRIMKKIIKE